MSAPSDTRVPVRSGIDPRGPRVTAGITAALLLTVIGLGLSETLGSTVAARAAQPAFLLFAAIVLLFAWGRFAGVQRHPFGAFFRAVIRPRLAAPSELEDPIPPTFAQGVGVVITLLGAILHLAGVPFALELAAGAAFIAAFLNAVFGYCLGCQIYLLLLRAGLVRRPVR